MGFLYHLTLLLFIDVWLSFPTEHRPKENKETMQATKDYRTN